MKILAGISLRHRNPSARRRPTPAERVSDPSRCHDDPRGAQPVDDLTIAENIIAPGVNRVEPASSEGPDGAEELLKVSADINPGSDSRISRSPAATGRDREGLSQDARVLILFIPDRGPLGSRIATLRHRCVGCVKRRGHPLHRLSRSPRPVRLVVVLLTAASWARRCRRKATPWHGGDDRPDGGSTTSIRTGSHRRPLAGLDVPVDGYSFCET